MASVVYKQCTKCKLSKPATEFHKHSTGYYGVRADCKDCVALYSRTYRDINSDTIKTKKKLYHKEKPEITRRSYLKRTYGISLETYNEMLLAQNNKCGICKSSYIGNKQHKHFHVDHCHKTGKIRGLLCGQCNSAIGQFKDNITILENAIKYIKENQ